MNDYINRTIDEYNKLPKNTKRFFAYLTYQCKSKGYCWKTNEQLAVENEVKAKSISRWLKTLRDLGLITSEMTKGVKMTDGSGRADYKRAISISPEWKISGKSHNLKHKNGTQTPQDDVVTMTLTQRQNDVDPASKCPSVNVKMTLTQRQNDVDPASKCPSVNVKMTLTQRQNDVDPASKSKEDNIYISKQNINSNKTDIKQEGISSSKSKPSLIEAPQRESETIEEDTLPVVVYESNNFEAKGIDERLLIVEGLNGTIKIPLKFVQELQADFPHINVMNEMSRFRNWCRNDKNPRPKALENAKNLLSAFVQNAGAKQKEQPVKELTGFDAFIANMPYFEAEQERINAEYRNHQLN